MLSAKFWIIPVLRHKPGVQVVNPDEHGIYAKRYLLNSDRVSLANWLAPATARELGNSGHALGSVEYQILQKGGDFRLPMIQYFNWIRICRHEFNCWLFNDSVKSLMKNATAYWDQQALLEEGDVFDVWEVSTNRRFLVPVKTLIPRKKGKAHAS